MSAVEIIASGEAAAAVRERRLRLGAPAPKPVVLPYPGAELEDIQYRFMGPVVPGNPVIEHIAAVRPIGPSIPAFAMQIAMIQHKVADAFGMDRRHLLMPSRRQCIVQPRQIAIVLSCLFSKQSLPEIGAAFNGLHHTTILYARRRLQPAMDQVPLSADDPLPQWIESLYRVGSGLGLISCQPPRTTGEPA